MFTNEIEFDETITTVMDDTGNYEDVAVFIDENAVYIKQWNEDREEYDLIEMTNNMFNELLLALDQGEGFFKVEE